MKILVKKGTTSIIQSVYITDTSNNALTGIAFDSGGLSAYYFRSGDTSATAITLADATLGTYTSGGFKEVDATNLPGLYEIHLPNAVFADGSDYAYAIYKGAATMQALPIEIQLVDARVFLPWVSQ